MAVTQLFYDADRVGIHPATQAGSGYKLDHNAYSVVVRLSGDLMDALNAQKGTGTLIYRFDSYDAAGGYDRTETAALTAQIEFSITKRLTRTSGNIRIIPVVTALDGNTTIFERRLGIITLNVKATPESAEDEYDAAISLSTLERSARDAAAAALTAKEVCLEAQEATESARAALEGDDTTFIFDGGDSAGNIPINWVVDDFISQFSQNPVTSRAIYSAIAGLSETLQAFIRSEVERQTAGLVAQAEANVYSKCYGKGGVIISADPDFDPNGIVPGTWELIGAGRTIICAGTAEWGTEYEVGMTGGEATHTLTVSEMPTHTHAPANGQMVAWNGGGPMTGGSVRSENGGEARVHGNSTISQYGVFGNVFYSGGGQSHNNISPFFACNVWVRVEDEEE